MWEIYDGILCTYVSGIGLKLKFSFSYFRENFAKSFFSFREKKLLTVRQIFAKSFAKMSKLEYVL
jgi:hypothetical protein